MAQPSGDLRRTIFFTGKDQVHFDSESFPVPARGELLIETTHSLISTGTEGICLRRAFAPDTVWEQWVKYPFRPGYLNVGRVIGLGDGVEGWSVGDRAFSRAGHTSHHLVRASSAVRVPQEVSSEDAAWTGLGKIAQVGVRAAKHRLGDSVVVLGLGLLGQLVVQYTRLMGARQVIAIDTAPRRLEMALAHGATDVLNLTAAEALKAVEALTDGRRADVVYDVTGSFVVFASALALPRRFGTVVLLGDTGEPQRQTLTHDLIKRGLRVVGAYDSHPPEEPSDHTPWSSRRIYELFLLYISRGQMRLADLVTHCFKPQDAVEAYAMLKRERETAMGVIFDWTAR